MGKSLHNPNEEVPAQTEDDPAQEPTHRIRLSGNHPVRLQIQQFDTLCLHCCHVSRGKGQALPFPNILFLKEKKWTVLLLLAHLVHDVQCEATTQKKAN